MKKWSLLRRVFFVETFTFHLTIGTCQAYRLRMVKHQRSSKPGIQTMEPSLRSLFLFQPPPSPPKISPFKSEAGELRWLMSDANVACSIITIPIGADVSHLFSGTRSQMSAGINAESAHDGQRNPLQEIAAGPRGEGTDSHHGNLIFWLTQHTPPLIPCKPFPPNPSVPEVKSTVKTERRCQVSLQSWRDKVSSFHVATGVSWDGATLLFKEPPAP